MASPEQAQRGISAVRVVVAGLLLVHGLARIGLHLVDDFGGFLEGLGLPLGNAWAWGITLFEIAGGLALVLGRWTRPIAVLLSVELAAGIALVHRTEGWFVVGAGRNGMEYSVLLIACLLAVAYSEGSNPGGSDRQTSDPGASPSPY